MRNWQRAAVTTLCGRCASLIRWGDPVQVIAIAGVDRRKFRCASCAGEAVPELPELLAIVESTPWELPAVLPFDFKALASGEREPGEDDD